MKNTIALCIPAYNVAWCLPRLLKSAINQHIPFNEILVYNDCSTDETAKIAKSFGAKVINGTTNMGCSFGKNALIEETMCEWIHFHDADDELLPNFTSLAHRWISQNACPDIVLFNYNYVDNLTNELIVIKEFEKQRLNNNPIAYSLEEQINPFCGLYRKSAISNAGGYIMDEKLLYNEDSAFHIKMAIAGLTYSAENEVAIINYAVSGSMSDANKKKCVIAQYHTLLMATEQLKQINEIDDYKHLLSKLLFKKSILLAANHAFQELDHALKMSKILDQKNKNIFNSNLLNHLFNRYPKMMYRIRAWYNRFKS